MLEQGIMILPGTGRWQSGGLTEGGFRLARPPLHQPSFARLVPLPVPGRIA
jgi:hypothetical protein